MKHIGQLDPVCTDVLDRRGTDTAGNQGQIFQSVTALIDCNS